MCSRRPATSRLINQKLSTMTATRKYNDELKKSESIAIYMIGDQVLTGNKRSRCRADLLDEMMITCTRAAKMLSKLLASPLGFVFAV